MYEEVLIATDGSDVAERAATSGIALARAFDATVRALSVAEMRDEAERCEDDATSIATRATEAGCESEWLVRRGRPASEILSAAEDLDADLLVVGTHGRTGIQQVLLGSVALEVIREARCPVLSVSSTASPLDETGAIDEVCLATDGWAGSDGATNHAIALSAACNARLHALYAVDVESDAPEIRDAFDADGRQTTDEVVEEASAADVEATGTVTHGPAHEVILDYVDDGDIDVLLMGTESKSTFQRLVVGSVSQRVVPNATVPVITVRTPN